MNGSAANFQIHSEARGPHWVAWIAGPGSDAPYRSILLVGETQEEAEGKAREWAAKVSAQTNRTTSSTSSSSS